MQPTVFFQPCIKRYTGSKWAYIGYRVRENSLIGMKVRAVLIQIKNKKDFFDYPTNSSDKKIIRRLIVFKFKTRINKVESFWTAPNKR